MPRPSKITPVHRSSPLTAPPWAVHGGDCLQAAARPAQPGTTLVDLFAADPPYNYAIDYGSGKAADRLAHGRFQAWCYDWLVAGCSRLRPGGAAWVVCPDEWAAELVMMMKWELGLVQRNWIKWHETFGPAQEKKFSRCSRHVLYFVKRGGPVTFTPPRVQSARQAKYGDKRANQRGKVPEDVWTISRVAGTFRERCKDVPTQIPEELWDRVVLTSTKPHDTVLEFFAGSGSLGRVAARHERGYEGWELNKRTAAVAARRIRDVRS